MGIYTVNLTFPGNASYSNPNGGSFPITASFFAGTINVSAVAVPTTMQLLILPPVAVTPASAPAPAGRPPAADPPPRSAAPRSPHVTDCGACLRNGCTAYAAVCMYLQRLGPHVTPFKNVFRGLASSASAAQ